MKDLSRHIEHLLCEHNSVAIPGIGIFITEELPARYYPEENLYLPPVRSVRLDTTNKEDDHKLENCLIQLHHVTRNVAGKWIAEYVDDINQSLMDMGIMDMGTMGRLVSVDGKVNFEVCEAGVNAPELYGLDSFHIAKLPAHAHKNGVAADSTHFTIRLRRTTVHHIMTAAAMIIVALTVIVPNYGSFNTPEIQARLSAAETLANIFHSTTRPVSYTPADSAKNTTIAKTASAIERPIAAPVVVSEEANVQTAEVQASASDKALPQPAVQVEQAKEKNVHVTKAETSTLEVKGCCIVMASAITNKGAEHLIAKLNKEGFYNAVKYNDKGMLRVLLTGYDSESAARAHIAVVRAIDSLYSGSWIKKF